MILQFGGRSIYLGDQKRTILVSDNCFSARLRGHLLKLIQPISKKNQVVMAIKDAIISGSIKPGDQIVESRLAQQLGSGIPLVREALIELEHLGFVQKTPYKGTTVTKLSPREIQEIFQLRVELEALAVEWAKANVTPDDIKELQKLIRRMEQSAAELDLDQFYLNDAFGVQASLSLQRALGQTPPGFGGGEFAPSLRQLATFERRQRVALPNGLARDGSERHHARLQRGSHLRVPVFVDAEFPEQGGGLAAFVQFDL